MMGRPEGQGLFEVMNFLAETLGLGNPGSERQGIAGGAEADGLIGVFQGFGKDGDAAEHQSLEFVAGEVGGILAEASQLLAKAVVVEPAVEGGLPNARGAGGLSQGGRGGDDGQGGLLARGKAGFFDFSTISSHSGSLAGLTADLWGCRVG